MKKFTLLLMSIFTIFIVGAFINSEQIVPIEDEKISKTQTEKLNEISFGNIISKAELINLEITDLDYTEFKTDNNELSLNVPLGWRVDKIEQDVDMNTYNIIKNGDYIDFDTRYYLSVNIYKGDSDMQISSMDSSLAIKGLFDIIDNVDVWIPIIENNQQYGYGPFDYVDVLFPVYNISAEKVSQDSVSFLSRLKKEKYEISIQIVLPKWNPDIQYDKEILTEIYSMIKSIKWSGDK